MSIVLAGPMLLCAANAVYALARQFIAGWLPSQWFSSNAADWLTAMGNKGGATDYIVFTLNALLAYGCWSAIRWAFTGKTE